MWERLKSQVSWIKGFTQIYVPFVDPTDARKGKVTGIVWVRPPDCRAGPECRPVDWVPEIAANEESSGLMCTIALALSRQAHGSYAEPRTFVAEWPRGLRERVRAHPQPQAVRPGPGCTPQWPGRIPEQK
jgi:hypothetical protein